MAEMTNDEKERELYKASLSAFFTNEIETDKIILTLSIGAIGFYSALLTSGSLQLTEIMFISTIIAVILYGITVAMVIGVFAQNKKQLLSIISSNGIGEEDPHLTFLDNHKYKPFIGAVIASIVFMLSLLFTNVHKEKVEMTDKKTIETPKPELSREGFSEIVKANSKNQNKDNNTSKKEK